MLPVRNNFIKTRLTVYVRFSEARMKVAVTFARLRQLLSVCPGYVQGRIKVFAGLSLLGPDASLPFHFGRPVMCFKNKLEILCDLQLHLELTTVKWH